MDEKPKSEAAYFELPVDVRPMTDEYVRATIRIQGESQPRVDRVALLFAKASIHAYEYLTGKRSPVTPAQLVAQAKALDKE